MKDLEKHLLHGIPERIRQRINVQAISPLFRNNCLRSYISQDTFDQRERREFKKLDGTLSAICGRRAGKAVDAAIEYASVIEEINFNLGMKVGALLICRLTRDLERDM